MPAQPITFTYPKDKTCTANIDFEGNEYILQWNGDWRQLPDLARFPFVENATVTRVPHSSSVSDIWARRPYEGSSLLHGWIPHLQVALDACQRRLLQDEFSILRRLSLHGRPVVRTHQQPLVDEDGIFGFRMERLIGINSETAAQYIPEIEKAIDSIHQCGVVVHDISPGHAGETIPPWKTIRTKTTIDEVFSVDADRLALGKTAGMETLLRKYDLATHDQLIGIISRTARLDE